MVELFFLVVLLIIVNGQGKPKHIIGVFCAGTVPSLSEDVSAGGEGIQRTDGH